MLFSKFQKLRNYWYLLCAVELYAFGNSFKDTLNLIWDVVLDHLGFIVGDEFCSWTQNRVLVTFYLVQSKWLVLIFVVFKIGISTFKYFLVDAHHVAFLCELTKTTQTSGESIFYSFLSGNALCQNLEFAFVFLHHQANDIEILVNSQFLIVFVKKRSQLFGFMIWPKYHYHPFHWSLNMLSINFFYVVILDALHLFNYTFDGICSLILHFLISQLSVMVVQSLALHVAFGLCSQVLCVIVHSLCFYLDIDVFLFKN